MPQNKYTLCLDVGGTKILGVALDENNHIVVKKKLKTLSENGICQVESIIFEVLDQLFHAEEVNGAVFSIGIGIPGILDEKTGKILFSPNIN